MPGRLNRGAEERDTPTMKWSSAWRYRRDEITAQRFADALPANVLQPLMISAFAIVGFMRCRIESLAEDRQKA